MSLLLDALKRAEEAKRAKAELAEALASPVDMRDAVAESSASATLRSDAPLTEAPLVVTANVVATNIVAPSIDALPIGAPNTPPKSALQSLSVSAHERNVPETFITTQPLTLTTFVSSSPEVAPATERAITSIKSLALSTEDELLALRATPLATTSALTDEETALAKLLQFELDSDTSYNVAPNNSPATAAYRKARSQDSAATKPTNVVNTNDANDVDTVTIEPVTTHNEQAQRDAVKSSFSAKLATRKSTRTKWVIPAMAGLVLFVGAGSWYVWQEVNRSALPRIASAPNPSPPSASPTIAVQPTPTASPPTTPTTQAPQFAPNTGIVKSAPNQAALGANSAEPNALANGATGATGAADAAMVAKAELDALPPLLPPPAIAVAVPLPPKSKVATVTLTPREALAKKIEDLPLPILPPNTASSIKLRPAKIETSIGLNPALAAAYAALNRGDYAEAKQTYASAIAQQPTNLDANLGFATAAARSGETETAVRYYRRVVDLDPRNATAAAALLILENKNANSASGGQVSMEAALKLLVEKDPSVAASHFALGNVLAAERRWREAQQAYFEATRLTPQNPDYLFNLAVSLDNLGQLKQAEDFYRRALAALANGQAQFDRAVVEKRLSAIAAMAAVAANAVTIK